MQPTKRILAVLFLLLLGASTVSAQTPTSWFVYLYNSQTSQLLRIYADGTQETFDNALAGKPADVVVGASDLAFNPAADKVAFCAVQYDPNGGMENPTTLFVNDVAAGANLFQIDLNGSIGCRAAGFNEDGSLLAVGVVNYYPEDPNADTSEPSWQLILLDANTGEIRYELNSFSDIWTATNLNIPVLPYVPYFVADQLVLVAVPYGVGGGNFQSLNWRFAENSLTPADNWGSIGVTYLGGELAWVDYDEAYPAAQPGGPIPALNVVKVADKTGNISNIFTTDLGTPLDTVFINDGRALAIFVAPEFDPAAAPETPIPPAYWVAVDRFGTIMPLDVTSDNTLVVPATGGFAAFRIDYDEAGVNAPSYVLELHAFGETRTLWSANTDMTAYWEIIAPQPAQLLEAQPPFTAIP
jgi:hypothetical protein